MENKEPLTHLMDFPFGGDKSEKVCTGYKV